MSWQGTWLLLYALADPGALPPMTALAFAPDSQVLLFGSQAGVQWTADFTATEHRTGEIETQLLHVHDLSFSPNGSLLAVAGGAPAESGAIEVYHWPTRQLRYRAETHQDVVYAVSWMDDEHFVSAGGDNQLHYHSLRGTHRQLGEHSKRVRDAVWLAPAELLASAGMDQRIHLWSPRGDLVRTLDNHVDAVNALAETQMDGRLVLASCGQDRTVRFWQPTVGRMMRFVRLSHEPLDCVWIPHADRLMVACDNGHLVVVESGTARILAERAVLKSAAYAVAIAPNGAHVAVAGGQGQAMCFHVDALLTADSRSESVR